MSLVFTPLLFQVLVEGVKIALAMAQTEAFNRLGTKFWDEVPIPGCEHTDLWSDEYWTCMCRQYTTTIYHHAGIYILVSILSPKTIIVNTTTK